MPFLKLMYAAFVEPANRGYLLGFKACVNTPSSRWTCKHIHRTRKAALWCARDYVYHAIDAAFRVMTGALLLALLAQPASAQITGFGPPLSPAAAADVMRQAPGLANLTGVGNRVPPAGPTVFVMGGRPGAAGWMEFPAPAPRLRLDGTPVNQAPAIYGSPFRYPVPRFETFWPSEGVAKGGLLRPEPHHPPLARHPQ